MTTHQQRTDTPASVGRTVLTTETIAVIAGLAARSVPGVVDLHAVPLTPARTIALTASGDLAVRLTLVAAYGVPIPALADEVRRAVVETVDAMTGLRVAAVDVAVQDVDEPADR